MLQETDLRQQFVQESALATFFESFFFEAVFSSLLFWGGEELPLDLSAEELPLDLSAEELPLDLSA